MKEDCRPGFDGAAFEICSVQVLMHLGKLVALESVGLSCQDDRVLEANNMRN